MTVDLLSKAPVGPVGALDDQVLGARLPESSNMANCSSRIKSENAAELYQFNHVHAPLAALQPRNVAS
ncbi:MAG: hypothetical protein IOC82_04335 [Aestuariivirga sp.]|nr:hypothetical protein [Aestuariivirga sp.]